MKSLLQKYIDETISKEAEIGYDKKVKSWYGVLEHEVGFICSQRKTKPAVKKELAEILEEFIILSLKEGRRGMHNEIRTTKIQGAYR